MTPFILSFLVVSISGQPKPPRIKSVQWLVRQLWQSNSDLPYCGPAFVSYIKQSCAPEDLLDLWNGKQSTITSTFEQNKEKICNAVKQMQNCLAQRPYHCEYAHLPKTTQGTEQLVPLIVACRNSDKNVCDEKNMEDCMEFHRTVILDRTAGTFCWKIRLLTTCVDFFSFCNKEADVRKYFRRTSIGWNEVLAGDQTTAFKCSKPSDEEAPNALTFTCAHSAIKDCSLVLGFWDNWKKQHTDEHPEGSCEFCSTNIPAQCGGNQYFNYSELLCRDCPGTGANPWKKNIGPYCPDSIDEPVTTLKPSGVTPDEDSGASLTSNLGMISALAVLVTSSL